jgi:hypothetical protein
MVRIATLNITTSLFKYQSSNFEVKVEVKVEV